MTARAKAPGRRRQEPPARPPLVLIVGGIVIAALIGLSWFALQRAPQTVMPAGHSPAAAQAAKTTAPPAERWTVKVRAAYPHDRGAYTQGLVLDGDRLYESTGLYGSSSVRRVDLKSGTVESRVDLSGAYFGEGLALVGDRLVQLTWREGKAFVYRVSDLGRTGELGFVGEGWGLCFDGEQLVMSDGSNQLTFRDPATLAVQRIVRVLLDGQPVQQLNELECVGPSIYANVYGSEEIVRIEKTTGRVTAVIDASGLLQGQDRVGAEVMNGIAYDATKKVFLLTGKLWPKLFEVELVRP